MAVIAITSDNQRSRNSKNIILDRAFGKPRQEVEQVGDAQPLEILIRHFNDEASNSVATTVLDDQQGQHA